MHRHCALAAGAGGHRVVEEDAGTDEGPVDQTMFEGEHEGDGLDEVGRGVRQQQIAFFEGFGHELEVEHLEVPQASVHELR